MNVRCCRLVSGDEKFVTVETRRRRASENDVRVARWPRMTCRTTARDAAKPPLDHDAI
jgi:hypothetical protein